MIRINLLPSDCYKKNRVFANISIFFLVAFVLAFICGIMSGIYLYNLSLIEKAEAERDKLMDELQDMAEAASVVGRIKNDIRDLEKRLAFLDSIDVEVRPFSAILSEIGSSVPDEAWLTYVTITQDGQLSIQGWSADFKKLSEFIRKLTNSGFFENIELVKGYRVDKGVTGAVNFELKCMLK